ncbi:MAG: GGDEF domain-containing protein, partial [Planctomycetes bacterium]|nr:GGDEF domain-containing protein [Planctomycetota bacterium]
GNLARMALIDPLTGLRNRRAMLEHLRFAVLRATRNKVSLGVMFIDLDGFKAVNDTRGHSAGDEVLRQVARRLQAKLRATDLCARIGGDEFTILIEDIETGDDLELVRQKVQRALSAPIDIDGHPQRVRASIGAAVFPEDGATAEALLQSADAAMYRRKRGRPDEARGQQDSQSG